MSRSGSRQSFDGHLRHRSALVKTCRVRSDHHGRTDSEAEVALVEFWLARLSEHPGASVLPASVDRQMGRPAWVVPATVTSTQTVKHHDACGSLLTMEIRAALGWV